MTAKPKRAAGYVRVSSAGRTRHGETLIYDQNPEVQGQQLRDLAAQRGWELVEVYSDRASGAKEKRPGLDALMADARRRRFDVVVVWRFDRFARSVRQLVLALEEFQSLGIDFVSMQEALDTSTPMGRAMFTIVAAMAELERSVIRERVVAGMEYARRRGTKSGKPIGRGRKIFRRDLAHELRQQGHSYRQIAQRLEIPIATLHAGLREFTPRSERVDPADRASRSRSSPASSLLDVQQGDGFGTPGQAVPAKTQKAAKRKTRIPPPPNDPARGLFADAMEEACRLKRKHRALFNANPKEFRQQVKKAASRVFRLKPGPKQDAKIAAAARERARGAAWEQLYAEHIDHYTGMPEFTRDLAEAGFKRKVNAYLHKPPQASLAQTQILPEDQGQQMIAPITRS